MSGLSGLGGLLSVAAGQSFGVSGGFLPIIGALGGGIFGGTSGMISGAVMGLTAWMSQENEETTTEEQITNNSFVRNAPVPICYGTNKYAGTCIAIGETDTGYVEYSSSGGKGGLIGGDEDTGSEQLYYYVEFAVAFAEGPINGFADFFINDESVKELEEDDEEGINLDFTVYLGSSTQAIDPDFNEYMTDGTALPWRYTAYLFVRGVVGYYASLPVISAEVVGFLSDTRGNITLDWEFDTNQYNNFCIGHVLFHGNNYDNFIVFTYNTLNYYYGISLENTNVPGYPDTNGYVYYWNPDTPGEERILISTTVTLGASDYPYNTCDRCVGTLVGTRIYCYVGRYNRYYDIFYIDTETNTATSVILNGQLPDKGPPPDELDYLRGEDHLSIGSMEIVGDYIYLFGCSGTEILVPEYSVCKYNTTAFVILLSKDSGVFSYLLTYIYLPQSYLEGGPVYGVTNCVTFVLDDIIYCQWLLYGAGGTENSDNPIYPVRTWKFCISGISMFNSIWEEEYPTPTNPAMHRNAMYDPIYYLGYYYVLIAEYRYYSVPMKYKLMRFPYGTVPNWYSAGFELLFEVEWNQASALKFYSYNISKFMVLYNGSLYFFTPANDDRGGSVVYRYNGIEVEQDSEVILEIDPDYNQQAGGTLYSCSKRASFRFPYDISLNNPYVYSLDCMFSSLKDCVPVEVVYNFMTNTRYGMGIPTTYFDGDPYTPDSGSWRTEYEFCLDPIFNYDENGELVREARFLYSKEFTDKFKAYDLISDVLQTCRGFIYYCDGKIKVKIEKDDEEAVIHFGNYQDTIYTGNSLSDEYVAIDDLSTLYPINFWIGDSGVITFYDEGFGSWYYGDTGYGEDTDGFVTEDFIICSQEGNNLYFCDTLSTQIPEGSTFVITKDNMKKSSFTFSKKSTLEKSNRFRLEYCDRNDEYRTDYLEKENIFDMESSGEIKEITYQMMGIKRSTQASRMITFLEDYETHVNWNCSFATDIVGMFLCIGTIVGVTHEVMGWQGKLFRIINMEETSDYEVTLDLLEYVPSVYSDDLFGRFLRGRRDPFRLTGKYDIPDHVVNLHGIEDRLSESVFISFSRPDNSPFWVGAVIYHSNDSSDETSWKCIGKSYVSSPSVNLSQDVSLYDTTIYYDTTTNYGGAFPANGSIFVDDEEIWYNEIDDVNNCFRYCIRGFNGTEITEHSNGNFCINKKSDVFTYSYSEIDINNHNYFRAISFTSFGVYADGLTAPTVDVFIENFYVLPRSVDSLRIYPILK